MKNVLRALMVIGSVIVVIELLAQAPPESASHYKYISSATTTMVVAGNGFLNSIILNGNTTAGTVTLYDIGSAGCSGTPASGKFATITAPATAVPVMLLYRLQLNNGLCVVTSQASDLTITFN